MKTRTWTRTDYENISHAIWAMERYMTEPDDPFVGGTPVSWRVQPDFYDDVLELHGLLISFDNAASLVGFGIALSRLYPELAESVFENAPMFLGKEYASAFFPNVTTKGE